MTVALLLQGQLVAFRPMAYYPRQGASKIHPLLDKLRAVQCILRTTHAYHPQPTLVLWQSLTMLALVIGLMLGGVILYIPRLATIACSSRILKEILLSRHRSELDDPE